MINICGSCGHEGSEFMCGKCSGNPDLVDNFLQKDLPPLKDNPNYVDHGDWVGNKKQWYHGFRGEKK